MKFLTMLNIFRNSSTVKKLDTVKKSAQKKTQIANGGLNKYKNLLKMNTKSN